MPPSFVLGRRGGYDYIVTEGIGMQTFTLTYPWDENGYKPYVEYKLNVDDTGFSMHITAWEQNPRRTVTEHQGSVHNDSCVEWFANFAPLLCDRYFNFEVNANGAMRVAFRKDRHDLSLLPLEDIALLNIQTAIHAETWEVRFQVPFALLRKYIPGYRYEKGMQIRTNFYKCGDLAQFPHFGIWKEYPLEKPDFHRPEFFGVVVPD